MIEIRLLGPADAAILDRVAPEVFDGEIDPELAREFLSAENHHLAVALERDEVVGFASAISYVHPDKPREMWIDEIGVAPTHRRRGLGRGLMERLFDEARRRGCSDAWLAVDPDNSGARSFYLDLGGAEEPAVCLSFRLDRPRHGSSRR